MYHSTRLAVHHVMSPMLARIMINTSFEYDNLKCCNLYIMNMEFNTCRIFLYNLVYKIVLKIKT